MTFNERPTETLAVLWRGSAAIVTLGWQPRDLWIGAYLERCECDADVIYVCLIPCFPIRIHL